MKRNSERKTKKRSYQMTPKNLFTIVKPYQVNLKNNNNKRIH